MAVAEKLGHSLMPWQRLVAEVGGELVRDEETGFWVPAYPEVVFTVPRQSGKTVETLAWEIDRSHLWESFDGKPQVIAYTAQSGSDARKKFRKDQITLLKKSQFWRGVDQVRLSAEDMSVEFTNGARIEVWNHSQEAGHGSTIDMGVMDEIFADEDERRDQALVPAMATRHDSQKLVTSTAGTELSVVLNRKQQAGRQAVAEGRTEGIAYFEWSADSKADPEDPVTWETCMPALGFTITRRTVRSALEQMRKEDGNLDEFKRAWLNISLRKGGDQVIPEAVWRAICSPDVVPEGRLVLGIDATPDRQAAAIVVCDERARVELIAHEPGVSWVADRTVELAKKHRASAMVDVSGPLGGLMTVLKQRGVRVTGVQPREVAYASGAMYDRTADGDLAVRSHPSLDRAVAGAQRRPMGDGWVWGRRTSDADISPLVALTLALAGATGGKPKARIYSLEA